MLNQVANGHTVPDPDDGSSQVASNRPGQPRTRFRRKRSSWLALAVVGASLVGGAYWAGTKATSPSALGKHYAPAPPTVLTARVVFQRLSEALPVQGTVTSTSGYKVNFGPVDVPGAQPIVTEQPPDIGTRVVNGSLLAQIAGRPVFAMLGATPMYRDLAVGDRGPDVAQLQSDLAALGFPSYDSRGVFGSSTLQAVRAFYSHEGYSLQQRSSSVISFVAVPVTSSSPSASTSSPSPPSSPSPVASSAPSTPSPSQVRSPSASPGSPGPTSTPSSQATSPTPTASPSATPSPGPSVSSPVVPQAEVVFVPRLPATIQSSSLKLGLPVTNPAVTLSTAGPQIVVQLTDAQTSLVQVKDSASLRITTAEGVVTEVRATVASVRSAGQDAQSGSLAVLQPSRPLSPSLNGDEVVGTLVIESTATAVLAVPVAALYTRADGQTLVTVVGPYGKHTDVPVQVNAEIGGYVPVRPLEGRLAGGDLVLVGQ